MLKKVKGSKYSKNIQTIISILNDEVRGDTASALKKMSKGYSMTWVYKSTDTLFPSVAVDVQKEMKEAYVIKGRKYEIKNIAEGKDVVMVELIESYPDPKTKKIYRTPLVLVLEMKDKKIQKGRHYCDPSLSYLHLSPQQITKAYRGTRTKIVIK